MFLQVVVCPTCYLPSLGKPLFPDSFLSKPLAIPPVMLAFERDARGKSARVLGRLSAGTPSTLIDAGAISTKPGNHSR